MHYDMQTLNGSQCYRIIGNCIIPRPIAWVTSQSADGIPNVAPFSFFNAIGNSPPMIVLGLVAHTERRLKDTAANIRETGEFVVNLVGEWDAQVMNDSSAEVPPEVDEGAQFAVSLTPSVAVTPQRIASAPASFECRTAHFIETGPNQVAILGEVLHAHIRDGFVVDPNRMIFDIPAMQLLSRLHGGGYYGRQTDMFEMKRPA